MLLSRVLSITLAALGGCTLPLPEQVSTGDAPPEITGFEPDAAFRGEAVRILGTHFGEAPPDVLIGGVAVLVETFETSDEQAVLHITMPDLGDAAAAAVAVRISTPAGSAELGPESVPSISYRGPGHPRGTSQPARVSLAVAPTSVASSDVVICGGGQSYSGMAFAGLSSVVNLVPTTDFDGVLRVYLPDAPADVGLGTRAVFTIGVESRRVFRTPVLGDLCSNVTIGQTEAYDLDGRACADLAGVERDTAGTAFTQAWKILATPDDHRLLVLDPAGDSLGIVRFLGDDAGVPAQTLGAPMREAAGCDSWIPLGDFRANGVLLHPRTEAALLFGHESQDDGSTRPSLLRVEGGVSAPELVSLAGVGQMPLNDALLAFLEVFAPGASFVPEDVVAAGMDRRRSCMVVSVRVSAPFGDRGEHIAAEFLLALSPRDGFRVAGLGASPVSLASLAVESRCDDPAGCALAETADCGDAGDLLVYGLSAGAAPHIEHFALSSERDASGVGRIELVGGVALQGEVHDLEVTADGRFVAAPNVAHSQLDIYSTHSDTQVAAVAEQVIPTRVRVLSVPLPNETLTLPVTANLGTGTMAVVLQDQSRVIAAITCDALQAGALPESVAGVVHRGLGRGTSDLVVAPVAGVGVVSFAALPFDRAVVIGRQGPCSLAPQLQYLALDDVPIAVAHDVERAQALLATYAPATGAGQLHVRGLDGAGTEHHGFEGWPAEVEVLAGRAAAIVSLHDQCALRIIPLDGGTPVQVAVPGAPNGIAVSPDGGMVCVAVGVDSVTEQLPAALAGAAYAIACDPEASGVACGRLDALLAGTGALGFRRSPVACHDVAFTPDGLRLYATLGEADGTVAIAEVRALGESDQPAVFVELIAVGPGPAGVAFDPLGGQAFIALSGDDALVTLR